MLQWQNLAPHRALAEGAAAYIPRPGLDGGERLARLAAASSQPVVVTGPIGAGKSTELARAAAFLREQLKEDALLVRLDWHLNMLKGDENDILRGLGQALLMALDTDHPLQGKITIQPSDDGRDTAQRMLRISPAKRVLVDGLEKCSDDVARRVLQALFQLEGADRLVVVAQYSMVAGPAAHQVIQAVGARIYTVLAVWLDGHSLTTSNWPERLLEEGYRFFYDMAQARLGSLSGLAGEFQYVVLLAAVQSGGVPRVFLQILLDAATNARLAGRELPGREDLEDAFRGQRESLRMLLREEDVGWLARVAKGLPDIEVPLERRLRFLAQGLLLEYRIPGVEPRVIRPAPLLHTLIDRAGSP